MTMSRLAVILLLGMAAPAYAAGISATVDRNSATLDDQLLLTITVEGSREDPALPDMPAFDVQGRGHSTQVQMVNGHFSSSASYTFVLTPKQVGAFSIGPAEVEVDGQKLRSEPINVTITAQDAPTGAIAGASPNGAVQAAGGQLFVTSDASTHTPYVGEQVTYTWRFYRRMRVGNATMELPSFDGFTTQDLGERREFQTTLNGQTYVVTEIRKALFAQQAGSLQIGPSALNCEIVVADPRRNNNGFFNSPFDDMFNMGRRENKVLRTAPIDLQVQNLPAAPANASGLVGTFQLAAQLSQNNVHVGDSTTLTLTVSGSGNVQHLPEPTLPPLSGFKVYDDKPVSSINSKGDALTGSKTFRKALVATQPGQFSLSPISLIYFDVNEKRYKTVTAPPLMLQVAAANAADVNAAKTPPRLSGGATLKRDVQVLSDDLLPNYQKVDALSRWPTPPVPWAASFAGAMLLPFAIFLLCRFGKWRSGRADVLAGERRRRTALQRGIKQTIAVKSALADGNVAQAAALASRSLREYLGDKLGVEGLALTPADASSTLKARGTPPPLADEVEELLGQCEAAQYSSGQAGQQMYNDLPAQLKTLLTKLDRTLRA